MKVPWPSAPGFGARVRLCLGVHEHRLRASESRCGDGKAAGVKDTDTGASQDYAYVARIGAGVGLPSRLADHAAGSALR